MLLSVKPWSVISGRQAIDPKLRIWLSTKNHPKSWVFTPHCIRMFTRLVTITKCYIRVNPIFIVSWCLQLMVISCPWGRVAGPEGRVASPWFRWDFKDWSSSSLLSTSATKKRWNFSLCLKIVRRSSITNMMASGFPLSASFFWGSCIFTTWQILSPTREREGSGAFYQGFLGEWANNLVFQSTWMTRSGLNPTTPIENVHLFKQWIVGCYLLNSTGVFFLANVTYGFLIMIYTSSSGESADMVMHYSIIRL